MGRSYHVFISDRGNLFMTEIAAVLAAALRDLGREVVYPAPGLPELRAGRVNLVVAPHEFFPLQVGRDEAELLRAAEASVMVGVEQPGTSWFELATHYASVARAVLDINPFAVAELRRRGVEATHLQLGYHPSWDRWGGDPARCRPTDLLFLGAYTPRRDRVLGAAAPLLWDCTSDIRLFEFPHAMSEPRGHFVASTDKWDLLAASRVLLNVHQNEVPYFEWVRVLEAVANGCLVVSESSSHYGPLVPGEHLVTAPVDAVAAYAVSLLADEDLRTEMATAAYDFVRSELPLDRLLEPICADLERGTGHRSAGREPLPGPPVPAPPAADPLVEAVLAAEAQGLARVKDALDRETELVRSVEAIEAEIAHGRAGHVDIMATSAWEGFVPEVSVVVTCHDYETYVLDAVRSAVGSVGVDVEVVVVDDHSEDRSVAAVRELMAELDDVPILLLAKAANGGVGAARHAGIAQARADRVFVLDADNLVLPQGLAKLSAALDQDPDAAFAYGILAKLGDEPGLVSCLPWDVARLTVGNYIDAMALVRRSVWDRYGDYDADASLRGLEDYELWLRLAAHGCRPAFVHQPIGRYRVHNALDQRTLSVNLNWRDLQRRFAERYPQLPWDLPA